MKVSRRETTMTSKPSKATSSQISDAALTWHEQPEQALLQCLRRGRKTKPLAAAASASASSANATRESPQVLLKDIHEYTPEMRIALKRNDAHMSVCDAVAQPEKEAVQATVPSQPRRAVLMMQRWHRKTKES